jgi:spore coat-associated protein N
MEGLSMENYGTPRRERRRRRGLLALLVAGTALISATGATMSLALFTSTVAESADFTSGTIVLTLTPSSTLFNVPAMMPGDSISQVLTVKNDGTGDLRYALSSSFTDTKGLAGQIDVTIAPTPNTCANAAASIFAGKLSTVGFGNPLAGFQAGDRSLAHGATEYLCVKASLDILTPNAFQGATASSTFTFAAEQTANNP